jgi:uncharacterized RDD family membrane protein YckC
VAWFREWLEGGDTTPPGARTGRAAPERPAPAVPEDVSGYPGERFGLPESGPGSVATLARRGGQFVLDALLAGLLALVFTFPDPPQNWSLLTWAILMIVPVAVVGATPAMALLGMRVVRLDRPETAGVGLLWTVVRTFSVFFVIPALIIDRDSRGIHDRASRTVVVRTR